MIDVCIVGYKALSYPLSDLILMSTCEVLLLPYSYEETG
jgi:hypothetical protein